MNPHEPHILDHEYDGIREFDNPLPRWWTFLMWASVFFSVPYFYYYTVGAGETLQQSYDAETAAFLEVLAQRLGSVEPDEPTIARLSSDATFMSIGRVLFRANCATCHAPDGGGGTGPNLTDEVAINVKGLPDLYRVIHDGVPAKGMPTWSTSLGKPQMIVLAAYASTLRGTTPAAPKAPQGDPMPPWPKASPPTAPAAPSPAAPDAAPAPRSSSTSHGG